MSARDLLPADLDVLDGLVQGYGLSNVVRGLVTVAHRMAARFRPQVAGKDATARLWDKAAYRLDEFVRVTWTPQPKGPTL